MHMLKNIWFPPKLCFLCIIHYIIKYNIFCILFAHSHLLTRFVKERRHRKEDSSRLWNRMRIILPKNRHTPACTQYMLPDSTQIMANIPILTLNLPPPHTHTHKMEFMHIFDIEQCKSIFSNSVDIFFVLTNVDRHC